MPVFTPIQNQSFIKVVSSGAISPEVNMPILATCKDNQGNTIKRTIVEIDASLGLVLIQLPSIESLSNDLDCEIDFIITDGTNQIVIDAFNDGVLYLDQIGQSPQLIINDLTYTAGAVITFKPAYEGYWSYFITDN